MIYIYRGSDLNRSWNDVDRQMPSSSSVAAHESGYPARDNLTFRLCLSASQHANRYPSCLCALERTLEMSSSNSPLPPRLPPPDVPAFLAWLDEQGAKRHEGFQLRYVNDGSGWGVYSSQCIPRGSVRESLILQYHRSRLIHDQSARYPVT